VPGLLCELCERISGDITVPDPSCVHTCRSHQLRRPGSGRTRRKSAPPGPPAVVRVENRPCGMLTSTKAQMVRNGFLCAHTPSHIMCLRRYLFGHRHLQLPVRRDPIAGVGDSPAVDRGAEDSFFQRGKTHRLVAHLALFGAWTNCGVPQLGNERPCHYVGSSTDCRCAALVGEVSGVASKLAW
jgi:hypothetical protein